MLTIGNSQLIDVEQQYKYYDPIENVFKFEPWKANLLLARYEEVPSLRKEVKLLEDKTITLESKVYIDSLKIISLHDDINTLDSIVTLESSQKVVFESLYKKALELNNVGEKSISGLEFALKREKIAKNWYRVSTGVTLATILTYTIVQLTKN